VSEFDIKKPFCFFDDLVTPHGFRLNKFEHKYIEKNLGEPLPDLLDESFNQDFTFQ